MKEILVLRNGNAFQPEPHQNVVGVIEWDGEEFTEHGTPSGLLDHLKSPEFAKLIGDRGMETPLRALLDGSTSLSIKSLYHNEETDDEDFDSIRRENLSLLS